MAETGFGAVICWPITEQRPQCSYLPLRSKIRKRGGRPQVKDDASTPLEVVLLLPDWTQQTLDIQNSKGTAICLNLLNVTIMSLQHILGLVSSVQQPFQTLATSQTLAMPASQTLNRPLADGLSAS
jgi:hypothetical protein